MYPGVDPTDSIPPESVGEQADILVKMQSEEMHESALKQAVKQVIDEYTVTDAWTQQELKFQIVCPSGQKCLAKKLTTLDLVESELLDEIDYFTSKLLTPVVDEASKEETKTVDFTKVLKDPVKRMRLFNLLDGLLNIGIVKPKIHLVPKDIRPDEYKFWNGPPLPKGEVWANKVDFGDKMFIFGELNKPLDEIKTFRLEQTVSVANMVTVEGISGEAK